MSEKTGRISFCLDCARPSPAPANRCPACGGRAVAAPPDAARLSIAHVDCDAFYAAVEKRDDPSIADRPVIVGGGVRGVVTTACYIARTYGVRSAMPMFKARRACPHAVVVKPDFRKYAETGRLVRELMARLTPLVEPLSIDEAFLDLTGTERLHGAPPAVMLARLQEEIKREAGITASVGLSDNKFLAKLASDLEKPEGFTVIAEEEAEAFLAPLPATKIWGVGKAAAEKLGTLGVRTIGDLQRLAPETLERRFGKLGRRLHDLSFGRDARAVSPERMAKSVSSETTFNEDTNDPALLKARLWELCEDVSRRMKAKDLVGETAVLKLKTAGFRSLTRQRTLDAPSNLARALFEATAPFVDDLAAETGPFRLIGAGYGRLSPAAPAAQHSLFESDDAKWARQEAAVDAIREKFGRAAISPGRGVISEDRRAGKVGGKGRGARKT